MNAKAVVLGSWAAVAVLATARKVTAPGAQGLPAPSVYLGSAVVYSMLYLGTNLSPELFATIAVGTAVGVLAIPYIQGAPSLLDQIAVFLGGQPAPVGPGSSGRAPQPQ